MSGKLSRNYHHGNLRAALLEAALCQLAEVGSENLSLRALAREVGVSQTAPYRHFADKNQLLQAMAARGYHELNGALRAAGATANATAEGELRAFAHCYIDFAIERPALFKLMFGPWLVQDSEDNSLMEAAMETYGLVRGIIIRAVGSHAFSEDRVGPLTTAAWSAIYGLAILSIDSPELFGSREQLHDQLDLGVTVYLRGIGA